MTQWFALSIHAIDIEFPVELVLEELRAISKTLLVKSTRVLNRYMEVFQEAVGLPPHGECDHQIFLKEGARPICLRPYRYGALQKVILEKMTWELLNSAVIQGSQSPFTSPLVLFRKKDNTRWICIDYRVLNNITIKAKFPIPIIEELLEELHGATLFTKLDLRSSYHQIRMNPKDIQKTAFRTHLG